MPCDSGGAGLVALGALVRDLQNPRANDQDGHLDQLRAHAATYSHLCGKVTSNGLVCEDSCNPVAVGCGLPRPINGLVRNLAGGVYRIKSVGSPFGDATEVGIAVTPARIEKTQKNRRTKVGYQNALTRDPGVIWILPQEVSKWRLDGHAPVTAASLGARLLAEPYLDLIAEAKVLEGNLSSSYSGLCLAGRGAGEKSTKEQLDTLKFLGRSGVEWSLSNLLSVNRWNDIPRVTRVCFYNTRTGNLDAGSLAPRLVVADGAQAMAQALLEFKESDVLGIVHRGIERELLEDLGDRVRQLDQWYLPDREFASSLPPAAMTINFKFLVSRKRL